LAKFGTGNLQKKKENWGSHELTITDE
jgi:hypothetical protein